MAKLPRKLNRFKKEFLRDPTKSPTDIALKVFNCKNRASASSIACEYLKKLNINLSELFERAGADDQNDVEFLLNMRNEATKVISCNVIAKDGEGMKDANSMTKDFVDVPDNPTRLKAYELEQRLKGRLKNNGDGVNQNNNITIVYGHRNPRETKKSDRDCAVRS